MADKNVFKRGGIWYIRYEEPRGTDGKRHQRMISCKGMGKKEAEQKLRDILTSMSNGSYVEPQNMPLSEYLEKWLRDYAKNSVTGGTFERYTGIIHRNIMPAIGHIRLDKVTPLQLQEFYNNLSESGRADGNGGLAPRTVVQIHRVLHRAFVQAIRWGLLTRNPADGVVLPRTERYKPTILSREQSLRLLEEASKTEYFFAPVLICLATGMRRGEVLALRWDNVDLTAGTISVVESLEETTANGLRWKETKTAGSTRTIVLPKYAISELKWWKAQQEIYKRMLAEDYHENGLVCTKRDGSPIRPDTFSSMFRSLVIKAGIDHARFHDLRHSQATMLIANGIPVKVVSERLGHSNTSITQDLYTHVLPTMQHQAADALDKMFGEACRKQD